MARLVLYGKTLCSTCQEAEGLIVERGLAVEVIKLDADMRNRERVAVIADLAWRELFEMVEEEVPVLFNRDTREALQGAKAVEALRCLTGE